MDKFSLGSSKERLASLFRDSATDLFAPIANDDEQALRKALEAGARVDSANEDGVTPLLLSVRSSRPRLAMVLLEAGANPNLADRSGYTPLMAASANLDVDMVTALIAKGANESLKTTSGVDAFEMVNRISLSSRRDKRGRIKLQVCAKLAVARAVREDDPEIEIHATTALQWAALADSPELMEEMLQLGAEPFSVNSAGKGLMEYAFPNKAAREIMFRELALRYRVEFEKLRAKGRLTTAGLIDFFESKGVRSPEGWTHWSLSDVVPVLEYLNAKSKDDGPALKIGVRGLNRIEKAIEVPAMSVSQMGVFQERAERDWMRTLAGDVVLMRLSQLADEEIFAALQKRNDYSLPDYFKAETPAAMLQEILKRVGLVASKMQEPSDYDQAYEVLLPVMDGLKDNGMGVPEIAVQLVSLRVIPSAAVAYFVERLMKRYAD